MVVTSYIINLKTSLDRKAYMAHVMEPFPYLKPVFVEAVNGREMTSEEQEREFVQDEAYRHYGRKLISAEIGCTLSHRKCAKALLDSDDKFALILEDDLIWQKTDLERCFMNLAEVLATEEPVVVLLSGDYWYKRKRIMNTDFELADVWDAVCAQAYLINRSAAMAILEMSPWYLADDWYEIRKAGISIKALFPHVADQNRAEVHTVIAEQYGGLRRENMSVCMKIRSYWRSMVDKILVWTDHFEAKNFKWE